MAKHRWRIGFAALCVALGTACADQGPSPLAPRGISGASLASDTVVTEFTVWPGGGKFNIAGTHRIVFPAGAICDLATSSYGPSTWSSPCIPSVLPVKITAKTWTDANGYPQVDFSPAMRFAPTLGDGVQLFLWNKKAAFDPTAKILYCGTNSGSGSLSSGSGNSGSESCVDESINDPSLATRFDSPNGFVYRRIKHFSVYNVTAGRAMDASSAEEIQ